jgi:probable F420-dependent oxidoreductase
MDEARRGEELGFGTGFISERWNVKEASSLTGAACAVTSRMQIATAATNHNTRHPLITGSWATTMHRLSGGRFTLGIGRGIGAIYSAFGIPAVTTAQMEDFAQVMRGCGRRDDLQPRRPDREVPDPVPRPGLPRGHPAGPGGVRPNTLKLGGRVFDDVILHTYFTPETLQRCVKTVKDAAEQAGRDPDSVRVWSCFATVGDHLPEELRLKKTVARLATYLQGYGDLLVKTNDWDPAVLERFRPTPWCSPSAAASTTRPPPSRSSTSPRSSPTSGWSPRRPVSAAVRREDPQGVRLRRRCPDHARRHARRTRADRRRLPRDGVITVRATGCAASCRAWTPR